MTQIPTIYEFYERLRHHDWYYAWSDDPQAYRKGLESDDEIELIAKTAGGRHIILLNAFTTAYFSGEPWGKAKVDPPRAPHPYTLYDLIDLRADYELARLIAPSGESLDQAHEVIQKVKWMGFYADPDAEPPILLKNTPELHAAWQSGQKLGMELIAQGEPV